jgi:hypothetical protein
MKVVDLIMLSLVPFVAAQSCDTDNDGDSDDCDDGAAVTATSTDVDGIVLTSLETSSSTAVSSSLVPVSTFDAASSTIVDVDTSRQTIEETTDIGTTPTNTIVQVATTTDIGLEGGYAYTTNSAGNTIATYTGTDDSQPRTSSISNAAATGSNDNDNDDADASETSSDSFAAATAVPYIGAAAMAGLAFLV